MLRLLTICALVAGSVLTGGCKKQAQFQEFASADGRFKVQMPGTPTEKTETAAGTSMKTFVIEDKNGGYMVAFADLPIPAAESEQQLEMRLDGARDGALRNVNASLTKENRIKLNGKYPGRDIEATIPDKKGALREKMYVVNQRLYQVLVIGNPSFVNSAAATKFLDSFALAQ